MTKNIIDERKIELIADEGKWLTNIKRTIAVKKIYVITDFQDNWAEVDNEEGVSIKEKQSKKLKNRKCPKTGKRCKNKTEECAETCDAVESECDTCASSEQCIKKILGI